MESSLREISGVDMPAHRESEVSPVGDDPVHEPSAKALARATQRMRMDLHRKN
jgi:hypothetical protein